MAIPLYVNTDLAAGGDGSAGNPYSNLTEALIPFRLAGSTSNPYDIFMSGVTQDPGFSGAWSLDHSVWEFVTSPTNKVRIFGNNATRKWNPNAHKIGVTNRSGIYNQYAAHVELYNVQLQVKVTDGGTGYNGFRLSTANNNYTNGAGRFLYRNCIARRDPTSTNGNLTLWVDSILGDGLGGGSLDRINCLAIGGWDSGRNDQGFTTDSSAWVHSNLKQYNCGAAKCWVGHGSEAILKNCWSTGAAVGFTGTLAGTDYCVEDDGNGVPGGGTHNFFATGANAFQFVDAANGDYGLLQADTGARGRALVNPATGLYLDDITGTARGASWDVGPTQFFLPTKSGGLMLLGVG